LLAVSLLLAVCIGGAIVFFNSLDHRESTKDTSMYSARVAEFGSKYVTIVPPAIPPNATGTRFSFESRSGLGPSSRRLELSFSVPPADARQLLELAKSMAPKAVPGVEITENEVRIEGGDQFSSVTVTFETGEVVVRIQDN
jgi:hypothetical protein